MKSILLLLALASFNVLADSTELDYLQDSHYTPTFKATAIQPICPKTAGGISCEAMGGNIIVQATLNTCIDSIVFFNAQIVNDDFRKITFVVVYSNAKSPTQANEVMCVRANTIAQKIFYQTNVYRDVRVINHFQNRL